MKLLTTAACVNLAASAGSISLFAQLQNNTEKQLTCNNNNGDRPRHCEVRELCVARNGRLTMADVRGQIKFDGVNGGVRLKRVSGEISGATVNGGIDVEMAGMVADWRQMDLKTNNGGITVAMPAQYSANVQAETGQG